MMKCFAAVFFIFSSVYALDMQEFLEAIDRDDVKAVQALIGELQFFRHESGLAWSELARILNASEQMIEFIKSKEMKGSLKELFEAVHKQDANKLSGVLRRIKNEDLRIRNEKGQTALLFADFHGFEQGVNLLGEIFDTCREAISNGNAGYRPHEEPPAIIDPRFVAGGAFCCFLYAGLLYCNR